MSCPGALVSRTAVPPVLATDHTLPSATNTIRSPNGCGKRGRAAWAARGAVVSSRAHSRRGNFIHNLEEGEIGQTIAKPLRATLLPGNGASQTRRGEKTGSGGGGPPRRC